MAAAPQLPSVLSDADALAALTAEVVGEHSTYALRIAARYSRGLNWLANDFESDALYTLVNLARKHVEDPFRDMRGMVSLAVGQRLATRLEEERRRHPDGWRRWRPLKWEADAADPLALLADARTARPAAEDLEQHEADLARAFELLDAIPEHWAELLMRVFADGTPLTDIARERGVHLTAVSNAVKRALRRVRLLGGIESPAGERIAHHTGVRAVTRERVSAARQKAERRKRAADAEERK